MSSVGFVELSCQRYVASVVLASRVKTSPSHNVVSLPRSILGGGITVTVNDTVSLLPYKLYVVVFVGDTVKEESVDRIRLGVKLFAHEKTESFMANKVVESPKQIIESPVMSIRLLAGETAIESIK